MNMDTFNIIGAIDSKSPTDVKHDIINQVKSGIRYMDGKSYKCNGMDSYSPCWNMMSEFADIFDLDTDLEYGQTIEDADDVLQDLQDIIKSKQDVIGYRPSTEDIKHAEQEYDYIDNNFVDNEILDTYHHATPQPLSKAEIMYIFHEFSKDLNKAKITDDEKNEYYSTPANLSIVNYF